jgi:hypothetical protein
MNLTPEIIVALITGAASIIAVVITTKSGNKEITHKLETNQAVTDTKLQALTDEVRQHNEFAKRMPVVEEQIKVINHRIDDLERSERNDRKD